MTFDASIFRPPSSGERVFSTPDVPPSATVMLSVQADPAEVVNSDERYAEFVQALVDSGAPVFEVGYTTDGYWRLPDGTLLDQAGEIAWPNEIDTGLGISADRAHAVIDHIKGLLS